MKMQKEYKEIKVITFCFILAIKYIIKQYFTLSNDKLTEKKNIFLFFIN